MLRIIGGSAKGTVLSAPAGLATRPTLGRTRESIFNVLANLGLLETRVLDIFAGTGAMGLEALSRGAKSATFIDKATGRLLRENAMKCHLEARAEILARDVSAAISSLRGREYDYIFMDPPYQKGYIQKILDQVLAAELPAGDAILIVEHHADEPISLDSYSDRLSVWKQKQARDTCVTYLHYQKQR